MKQYEVEIKGKTPYMQHRMNDQKLDEWEKKRHKIIERPDVASDDLKRALMVSYEDDKGFFIPSEHVLGSLINAGKMVKSKVGNAKKSMANIVAGMFYVSPAKLYLRDDFVVDKRSAVNHAIKGRVIVIRPKWESWSVKFTLNVDNDSITSETVKEIITNAGQYVGIGSFTPRQNGMFGRFELTKFKIL